MNNESIFISKATGISVAELFQSQAIKNPQALAVINLNGDKYTYKAFLLRVLKLSTVLIKKGIKPKDRIAILESELPIIYLEILRTRNGMCQDRSGISGNKLEVG